MLQPFLHIRVNPAAPSAMEEDVQGAHKVPSNVHFDVLMWLGRQQREKFLSSTR